MADTITKKQDQATKSVNKCFPAVDKSFETLNL